MVSEMLHLHLAHICILQVWGEVIGDTGGVKIDESSMMTISIQNKLSVINGTVEIPKSVNTALTNGNLWI